MEVEIEVVVRSLREEGGTETPSAKAMCMIANHSPPLDRVVSRQGRSV